MKKYATQMKEHDHASEYTVTYDRTQVKKEMEKLCQLTIRNRQFPAIFDF